MRIGIDMGHTLTGAGTGAVGFVKESDKNREVGKRLIKMFQEEGNTVFNCTVDKSNSDLADRVALANKQSLDVFISLHLNAYQKVNNEMGVETYYCAGSTKGKAYAEKVQNELVNTIKWKNRGTKTANYYVLKHTSAPAILVELGFCDSKGDMDKWHTENIAKAIFKGITGKSYSGNTTTEKPSTDGVMYRVVCGSYSKRENAVEQQNKLKSVGYSSFLDAFVKDGTTFFRVIAGSYKDRANADRIMNELKSKGFDPFIAVYGSEKKEESKPAPSKPSPSKPKPTPSNDDDIIEKYRENGYAIPRTTVNVRNKPSTKGNSPVASYGKGERFNYDMVYVTRAYIWVSYVSGSGVRRYVAVKDVKKNERFVDCY